MGGTEGGRPPGRRAAELGRYVVGPSLMASAVTIMLALAV
ncbi:hypothetical protein GFS60_06473 (plasmid) [Rhodococcus sp. WAY2]|nr:hypothetical protein GFS60_06473 [Rhodococcus sp. WAY2]